jgi:hypothetical protein
MWLYGRQVALREVRQQQVPARGKNVTLLHLKVCMNQQKGTGQCVGVCVFVCVLKREGSICAATPDVQT